MNSFLILYNRRPRATSDMSRLHKEPTVVAAPEPTLLNDEQVEVEAYEPKHPLLAELDHIRAQHVAKPDHLDKYVEVDPFAKKAVVAEETAAEEKE